MASQPQGINRNKSDMLSFWVLEVQQGNRSFGSPSQWWPSITHSYEFYLYHFLIHFRGATMQMPINLQTRLCSGYKGESWAPRGNSLGHWERANPTQHPRSRLTVSVEYCEAVALPAAPLCHPQYSKTIKSDISKICTLILIWGYRCFKHCSTGTMLHLKACC